jgi:hypothetical protein
MDRLERHAAVQRVLAGRSDAELVAAVAAATPIETGIGGPVAAMEIEGAPVFVKTVRLTDRERAAERSTANLFDLPLVYQYGIGSAGFGAWRELEAHELTTAWVTTGACAAFPLMHHARVLPVAPMGMPDLEEQVAAWGGSPAVRARLTALGEATAGVVLFLEHFPHDLAGWLEAAGAVPPWLEPELLAVASFLGARDFVHFDMHFRNLLTDGERLYVSDFGLALSSTFTLSDEERAFLERHRDFDREYVLFELFRVNGDPRHAAVAASMRERGAALRASLR